MISPFLHLQNKTPLIEMSIAPLFPQVWVKVKDEAVLGVFISRDVYQYSSKGRVNKWHN